MHPMEDSYAAAELLLYTKNGVRNGAIAITESSTPAVRQVLQRSLNECIELHGTVFDYMLRRGVYPSYQLDRLLRNDFMLAHTALSYPFG